MFEWDFQEGRESTDDYDYMSDSDLEDADDPGAVQSSTTSVKGKDGTSSSGDSGLGGITPKKGEAVAGGTSIPAPQEVCDSGALAKLILPELRRQQTDR